MQFGPQRLCPVTPADVRNATSIYGPNLGSLKGKTVYRPSPHVSAGTDGVLPDIMAQHRNVTLAIDPMFVNKIPFLITVSRHLRFVTVTALSNRQIDTLRTNLQSVVRLYHLRGFDVTTLLADPEFEALRADFPILNTCEPMNMSRS